MKINNKSNLKAIIILTVCFFFSESLSSSMNITALGFNFDKTVGKNGVLSSKHYLDPNNNRDREVYSEENSRLVISKENNIVRRITQVRSIGNKESFQTRTAKLDENQNILSLTSCNVRIKSTTLLRINLRTTAQDYDGCTTVTKKLCEAIQQDSLENADVPEMQAKYQDHDSKKLQELIPNIYAEIEGVQTSRRGVDLKNRTLDDLQAIESTLSAHNKKKITLDFQAHDILPDKNSSNHTDLFRYISRSNILCGQILDYQEKKSSHANEQKPKRPQGRK